jgi:hypothetical protein
MAWQIVHALSRHVARAVCRYYTEGVYYREDCGQTEDDLDHAVVLVGYGTTESGVCV